MDNCVITSEVGREPSEIEKRIQRVEMLTDIAIDTSRICENIGNNLLGLDSLNCETDKDPEPPLNGTFQKLDNRLDMLERMIRQGQNYAERIRNI